LLVGAGAGVGSTFCAASPPSRPSTPIFANRSLRLTLSFSRSSFLPSLDIMLLTLLILLASLLVL
jgi:hypothetical protein